MKRILLIAAMAAGLRAESICGAKIAHPGADYAQAICVDHDAMKRVEPLWPLEGKRTQVIVHTPVESTVCAIVKGKPWVAAECAVTILDAYGHWVALLQFGGINWQSVELEITPRG